MGNDLGNDYGKWMSAAVVPLQQQQPDTEGSSTSTAGAGGKGEVAYFFPYYQNRILRFDPQTEQTELVGEQIDGFGFNYTATIRVGQYLYGIPDAAKRVLKFHPATNTISYIGEINHGRKWFGGIFVDNVNDKSGNNEEGPYIYGIPYNLDQILRLNVSKGTTEMVGPNFSDYGRWKFDGGCFDGGQHLYFIPHNAQKVLRYNIVTEQIQEIENPNDAESSIFPDTKTEHLWSGGTLFPNDGCIYAAPCNASQVLKIQTTKTSGLSAASPVPVLAGSVQNEVRKGMCNFFICAWVRLSFIYNACILHKHMNRLLALILPTFAVPGIRSAPPTRKRTVLNNRVNSSRGGKGT